LFNKTRHNFVITEIKCIDFFFYFYIESIYYSPYRTIFIELGFIALGFVGLAALILVFVIRYGEKKRLLEEKYITLTTMT